MQASLRGAYQWAYRHDKLTALALYAAVTGAFFFPVFQNFSGALLSGSGYPFDVRDGFHFLWNFWWVAGRLASGQGIYHTNLLLYPQGTSLVLQTLDTADALLSAPVQAVAGLVAAYNSLAVASTVACAAGMYLYLRPHTGRGGSFVAGLVFGFFPQRLSQLFFGHPNLASLEWFPLMMVCLRNAERDWRYALAAGACLALIAYTGLELLVMAALLMVLYSVYRLAAGGRSGLRAWSVPLGIAIGTGALIASPFLVQAALAAGARGNLQANAASAGVNSAIPLLYLVPSPVSGFLSKLFLGYYSGLPGAPAQWSVDVGWSVLALSVLGAALGRGKLRYLFVLVGVVSALLSLGPGYGALSLPYSLIFEHIPLLHLFRTPARLSLEVMFALSALAGLGTAAALRLAGRRFGPRGRQAVAVALVCLVAFEYFPATSVQSAQVPAWTGMIAKDSGNFSVLVLPYNTSAVQRSIYYSTVFDKPLVDGAVSQLGVLLPDYMFTMPYLSLLTFPYPSVGYHDVFQQPASDQSISTLVLSMYRIRYVVVFATDLSPSNYKMLTDALTGALGAPVYNDYEYQVYRLDSFVTPQAVAQGQGTTYLVLPHDGWGTPYYGERNVTRSSSLLVYSTVSSVYSLAIGASTPGLQWCASSMNATFAAVCSAGDQTGVATLQGLQLVPGWNVLNLALSAGSATVSSVRLAIG